MTDQAVSLQVDRDQVAWLTFDLPDARVNLLSADVMRQLDRRLGELESTIATGRVVAVVVESGKPGAFIAGADVREIARLEHAEEARDKAREGQRIFRRLERLTVPTVAAVDGTCLGGGTELILACDHRVASDREATKIGLPEVKLGILPGFGGTVRLPRLIGLRAAMDIILPGRSVSAAEALRLGLVDRVAPHGRFREEVEALVRDALRGRWTPPERSASLGTRLLEGTGPGRKLLFGLARRRTTERTGPQYPAPLQALDVMEETRDLPIDRALEVEAEALGRLVVTETSRNLVRLFLVRQGARKAVPEERLEARRRVERAGVLGAGVMGGGIAELIVAHDIPVLLKDIEQRALDEGLRHAHELLRQAARKGVFSEEAAGLKFALIEGTLSYDGFEAVDLVVEAVVERMPVKRQVLRECEERMPAESVFATNTSALSVAELASAAERPGRVVGLHFFNPVHKMPLVEVVRPEGVDEEALAAAFGFVLDLGKTPVVVADRTGFLVNRLLAPYLNEAGFLLEEGAGVEALDAALEAFGMPMGPCRLLDEVGFDVAEHVAAEMTSTFGERMRSSPVVELLREAGRLGRKNGRGFYNYDDDRRRGVDREVVRALRGLGGVREPEADEMRRRCLYAMVNEAARALEEGVVSDADRLDLAMVMGTGFPPFRGGPLRWADRQGLGRVVEGLREFESAHGNRFAPAPRLARLAEAGDTFTDPA